MNPVVETWIERLNALSVNESKHWYAGKRTIIVHRRREDAYGIAVSIDGRVVNAHTAYGCVEDVAWSIVEGRSVSGMWMADPVRVWRYRMVSTTLYLNEPRCWLWNGQQVKLEAVSARKVCVLIDGTGRLFSGARSREDALAFVLDALGIEAEAAA